MPEFDGEICDGQDVTERPVETTEDGLERAQIRVRRRLTGRRLDKYLHSRLPRLSRTMLQRLIKQGVVTVNGKTVKPSYEPDGGDLVELVIPPPEPTEIVPEPMELDIVYEDEHMLAVNKPTSLVCHPARSSQTGTLANGLAHYSEHLSRGSDPFRPGIVHRLDKNTTGILLVAKTDEAHWKLGMQFEQRTIHKTYLAVVEGTVQLDADVIDSPIGNHPDVHDRYLVADARIRNMLVKQAVTRYEVVRRFRTHSIVRLYPKTGRTHQLRVHMSYIGHPMVGDRMYGGHALSERLPGDLGIVAPVIDRQALHAYRIEFQHPIFNKPMVLEAPLPEDLQRLIDTLEDVAQRV